MKANKVAELDGKQEQKQYMMQLNKISRQLI